MSRMSCSKSGFAFSLFIGAAAACILIPTTLAAARAPERAGNPLFHPSAFGPGRPAGFRGRRPQGDRLPARRHRHGHRLARRPGPAARLGDLQPARQGRDLPFTFFAIYRRQAGRPPSACSKRQLLPPFAGRDGIPPHEVRACRAWRGPFTGAYPFARVDFDDADAARSRSSSKRSTRSSRSTPTTPASRPPSSAHGSRNPSAKTGRGHASPGSLHEPGRLRRPGRDARPPAHATFGSNLNAVRRRGAARRSVMTSTKPDAKSAGLARWPWRRRSPTSPTLRTGSAAAGGTTSRASGTISEATAGFTDLDDGSPRPTGATRRRLRSALGLARARRGGESLRPRLALPQPVRLLRHRARSSGRARCPATTTPPASPTPGRPPGTRPRTCPTSRPDAGSSTTRSFPRTLPPSSSTRLEPDVHHPHDHLPAARRPALLRLRGLRRQGRLLPAELHPRLELRAERWPSCSPARTHDAPDRLPEPTSSRTAARCFRTTLPLGKRRPLGFHAAADGQMGRILKLYREWQLSGDDAFLQATLAARQAGAGVRLDRTGTPTGTA